MRITFDAVDSLDYALLKTLNPDIRALSHVNNPNSDSSLEGLRRYYASRELVGLRLTSDDPSDAGLRLADARK